ncbi:hypothetical protein K1T71_010382 [Dendrolimus kikuchii]|uniref:Uncharacterized protein n=1 Tax=Dendrolimus kikuchii TaxID=765133 RepID=A0ACC1CRL2_9NEOP|nr:hypothetical protein K1T71_010382 [Dendrolimus kikuchii]
MTQFGASRPRVNQKKYLHLDSIWNAKNVRHSISTHPKGFSSVCTTTSIRQD